MGKKQEKFEKKEGEGRKRRREGRRRERRGTAEGSCSILPDVWNEVRVHNI